MTRVLLPVLLLLVALPGTLPGLGGPAADDTKGGVPPMDREPQERTPRRVAEEAFEDFRHGLKTGEWEGFLGRLSEDFTFRYPGGRYQGTHTGKEKAKDFFAYISRLFDGGIEITAVDQVTAEDNRVVFEFQNTSTRQEQTYRNILAISLDICGDQICAYREYFGLVGPAPRTPLGEEPPTPADQDTVEAPPEEEG